MVLWCVAGLMHSLRGYGDSDEDDDTGQAAAAPAISGQLSISSQMAGVSVNPREAPPLTDAEIDAALCNYEQDDNTGGDPFPMAVPTAKSFFACTKHSECIHNLGKGHPGRCVWFDDDSRTRKVIPDDAPGWLIAKPMKVEKEVKAAEVKDPRESRKAKEVMPNKGSKRKTSNPLAAALEEADKATRAAEMAEATAKKAKVDAESRVIKAATAEKEKLRREAVIKKREAAKMRLLTEKAARQAEREAAEMEAEASALSQQYGYDF